MSDQPAGPDQDVIVAISFPDQFRATEFLTAASAGLWSAFIGLLLAGPVGMVVAGGIGAGAGALAAKVVDLGIPDEWVDWLKEATEPGRTVLAILVSQFDHEALIAELERFQGARLLYGNLPVDTLTRIHEALHDTSTT